MIAVADSSPLVFLAKLDCFELLHKVFARVVISPEVYMEVVVAGHGLPGAPEVANAAWIERKQLQDPELLNQTRSRYPLGIGELSTILLAKELKADAVLLDDHQARTLAKKEGLFVMGTVGLLESFHLRGHLHDLRKAFLRLLGENAFIDKRLLDLRLKSLGLPSL